MAGTPVNKDENIHLLKSVDCKCVLTGTPPEYVEHQIRENEKNLDLSTLIDIKACALTNSKKIKRTFSEKVKWINIKVEFSQCDKTPLQTVVKSQSDKFYSMQCCSVDLPDHNEEVLLVTFDKFFNICNYFGITDIVDSIEINVGLDNGDSTPISAELVHLQFVNDGQFEISYSELQSVVHEYFCLPRLLRERELFGVDLKEVSAICHGKILDKRLVERFYFKVEKIDSECPDDQRKGFQMGNWTQILMGKRVSHPVPPITKKMGTKNGRATEIPLVPHPLRRQAETLWSVVGHFMSRSGVHRVPPLLLLRGRKGTGKKTVVRGCASNFGAKLIHINCFEFIGMDDNGLTSRFTTLLGECKSPTILLLENIELLVWDESGPVHFATLETFCREVVSRLLDDCSSRNFRVVIVGTVDEKNWVNLSPAVRRIFPATIRLEGLEENAAWETLLWLAEEAGVQVDPTVRDEFVAELAGFVFADVVRLFRLAVVESRGTSIQLKHLTSSIDLDPFVREVNRRSGSEEYRGLLASLTVLLRVLSSFLLIGSIVFLPGRFFIKILYTNGQTVK